LVFSILAVVLGIYAVLIEPRWVAARKVEVAVPDWAGPAGLKVAVASDWHFTRRPFWRVMTAERARAIVQDINESKPDVILLPGDFIADRNYVAEIADTAEDEIASVLGELHAPLGVYAVLGNHEWWHGGENGEINRKPSGGLAFAQALSRRGITVLENRAVLLGNTNIWVAGIGDDHTGHSQPMVMRQPMPDDAQALVMMHDPASLRNLPKTPGLIVAGHTHGGQVYLPWLGALITPGSAPRRWAYGWIKPEAETQYNTAYVTSGLGVSIVPLRFNMRPEWVTFTIRSAAAGTFQAPASSKRRSEASASAPLP
jgi:uncharacterized protein